MLRDYFEKMKGGGNAPPQVSLSEIIWSWIGSFLGIGLVAYLNSRFLDGTSLLLVIGSFGATAVLIYGVPKSPLAQPRKVVGGHILSAFVGVAAYQVFHPHLWLAAALAVSTAIVVMHVTRTIHPPGGATALIAVIGDSRIHNLGYLYVLIPVAAGAVLMIMVALLVNNLSGERRYPDFWI